MSFFSLSGTLIMYIFVNLMLSHNYFLPLIFLSVSHTAYFQWTSYSLFILLPAQIWCWTPLMKVLFQLLYFTTLEFLFGSILMHISLLILYLVKYCSCTFLYSLDILSSRSTSLTIFETADLKSLPRKSNICFLRSSFYW